MCGKKISPGTQDKFPESRLSLGSAYVTRRKQCVPQESAERAVKGPWTKGSSIHLAGTHVRTFAGQGVQPLN